MSIVGGLVDTGPAERSIASQHSGEADWVVRNAWGLIITGSSIFWLTVAVLLIWR